MMRRDPAALFFGAAALLTLGVSIPATFALLRPFHDAGGYAGWGLTFFAMLVFEVGAVGAKLITIAIPQWRGRLTLLTLALLVLTSVGNYLHGAELWRAAVLPPTLAGLRGAWLEPWLVAGAAALFPALLFVWLLAFTARVEHLTHRQALVDSLSTELAETRTRLTQALAERNQYATALDELRNAAPVLVDTPQPRLAAPVDTRPDILRWRDDDGLTFDAIGERLSISRQAAQARYATAAKKYAQEDV